MSLKSVLSFLAAVPLSIAGAIYSANWIEIRSADVVETVLIETENDWAEVTTDGLQVVLNGRAPSEATRFRVVSLVGQMIDPDRIVDQMVVTPTAEFGAPDFSVEMLRNGRAISLIGLIPDSSDRAAIAQELAGLKDVEEVTDLLESSDYKAPPGWDAALGFATDALRDLPRSKVSATPGRVSVTAISTSASDKRRIGQRLKSRVPSGVTLVMDISAPRPVITPFTLRYKLDGKEGKFDACSADTPATAARILRAAREIGYTGSQDCAIGLGMPSPYWSDAVETALKALSEIGGGALTFSDADVTLVAPDTTPQSLFDRVSGELEANLPDVFSLNAVLPEKVVVDGTGTNDAVVEFVATRSPEGQVQMRGRLPDDKIEQIVGAYARAQFGTGQVYLATRDDEDLPEDWAIRVLAALEALATLDNGAVVVQPDYLEVRGTSGSRNASDEISRHLADKLGDNANFDLQISYDELLDPELNIPSPQECVNRINAILAAGKIEFEPSSSDLTEAAGATMDQIAASLRECRRTPIEIGGHTDSQGREIMNLELSQARADAVLAALMERRILTRNIVAKGYGETVPIGDNDTEEGREQNRRIEFKLLTEAPAAVTDGPDNSEQETATDDSEAEAQSE